MMKLVTAVLLGAGLLLSSATVNAQITCEAGPGPNCTSPNCVQCTGGFDGQGNYTVHCAYIFNAAYCGCGWGESILWIAAM